MHRTKSIELLRRWLVTSSGVTMGAILLSSPPAMGLSAVEVGKIAKSVTVSIDSANSVGSGVVIRKEGSTYTVLTAAHVVRNRQEQFKLTTPDGKNYSLIATNIKATTDADLAIVKFQSPANYAIAKLGNVETASEGAIVYVSGFPLATTAITESIYNFTEGKVTANANRPLVGGYSLVYSNNTLPGMSGGQYLMMLVRRSPFMAKEMSKRLIKHQISTKIFGSKLGLIWGFLRILSCDWLVNLV